MQFGKSIRIYLKDGNVTGIKFAEVVNQTIQSISCPRLKLSELNSHAEAKRPGVYFLFGLDEQTSEPIAYIGEAENVYDRLQQHSIKKDFWNEVVIFVSKDENLTKAHVRYLESRLIQISLSVKRYNIDNSNQSQPSSLPLADRDAMEEFLTFIKLLIGVLGHKILEEVIQLEKSNKSYEIKFDVSPSIQSLGDYFPELASSELYLKMAGISAKSLQTNEGIVVLTGYEAAEKFTTSLGFGYREFREKLIQSNQLILVNNKYIFQNDVLFDSPSAAAAIILGYSANGRINWKNAEGKSLKEIELEKLKNAL
jgi:hypothetical protein